MNVLICVYLCSWVLLQYLWVVCIISLQKFFKIGFRDSMSLSSGAIVVCSSVLHMILLFFISILPFLLIFFKYHSLRRCIGA